MTRKDDGREAAPRRSRRALGRDVEDALLANAPVRDHEDPTSGRNLAILFGCPTVVVLLLCLGGGLTWQFARGFVGDPGDPGPSDPLGVGSDEPIGAPVPPPPLGAGGVGAGGLGTSGSGGTPDPAQAAMRPRYRPGPFVTVQGLLPAGLTNQGRLTSDQRTGRTVETPWIVPGAELRAATATAAGGPRPGLAGPAHRG